MIGPQTTRNGIVAINPRTTRGDEAWDHSPTGMNVDVSRPDMMPSCGGVRGTTESNKKAQYQKAAHSTFSIQLVFSGGAPAALWWPMTTSSGWVIEALAKVSSWRRMKPSCSSAVPLHVLGIITTLPLLNGLERAGISLQPIGPRRSAPVQNVQIGVKGLEGGGL